MSPSPEWLARREHGSALGVRAGRFLVRTLGRHAGAVGLWPTALYFALADAKLRRASQDWLATAWQAPAGREALGAPPGFGATLRHVRAFAENVFHRTLLWGGDDTLFEIDHHGGEALLALAKEGRGAVLYGAHLGSFDMLRLIARLYGLSVNVLMYTDNTEQVNAFFAALGDGQRMRVIALRPGSLKHSFEIKAALARGEFVGILADRLWPGSRERAFETSFAGRPAGFPLSPFLLGTTLGAPLFLSLCFASGPRRYFAVTEPLFAGGMLPRAERERAAADVAERYVRRLESYALAHPLQWFNFYDFWGDGLAALAASRA